MKDIEHRYQEVSGLQDRSACKIFYGPVRPAPVMVLGINPGGDPAEVVADSLHRRMGWTPQPLLVSTSMTSAT